MLILSSKTKYICSTLLSVLLVIILVFAVSYLTTRSLKKTYVNLLSHEIKDRHGISIKKYINSKNLYVSPIEELPIVLQNLLLKKEDKYFFYHLGVNPISIARSVLAYIQHGDPGGSSTISQQLVKILLGNEQDRNLFNKFKELVYVFAMEIQLSKKEILTMYVNSVYLGNQAQGFNTASAIYFNKPLSKLTEQEIMQLLATLSSPSEQNPWKKSNIPATTLLAKNLEVPIYDLMMTKNKAYEYQKPSFFELNSLGISCKVTCTLTLDSELNEKIREILNRNVSYSYERGVRNASAVVIKVPENELLAIVGSRDPKNKKDGSKINMAIEPRPIGSTVKPFIYAKAFEIGLRPYTLVDDREYKYSIASGFSLYPKNYDGKYRGTITLHSALSNSLNVPTVKTLEYIGLSRFYDFLENDLRFLPIQDLDSYQYGIALGGLEMDLLTLTQYFTIFANNGVLKPLQADLASPLMFVNIPQSDLKSESQILDKRFIQLVNKILSDRSAGVNQFGLVSNLNLTQNNYAVKTGTSRDFHDSWVVGYTPDFVVGVWLGNSKNTALDQISGQSGAGLAWQEIMELLFTTEYNKKTPFKFDELIDIPLADSLEYGLPNDDIEKIIYALTKDKLILSPHDNDLFEFKPNTNIPLSASQSANWYIDGVFFERGSQVNFRPVTFGTYEIEARDNDNREIISIKILEST